MIVTYIRSSSLGSYEFCPMSYYFIYELGMKNKQKAKATYGSVVHKNLELLGRARIAEQNGKKTFKDDEFGTIKIKDITIEKLNDLSFEYYDKAFPGLMAQKDKKLTLDWTNRAISNHDGEMDPRNQNIHSVEEFFEVDIPHDWAKYTYEINGKIINGRLGLKGTVDVILKEDELYFHILDYKGLPIETEIPTPNGWSTIGDLKIGDVVFDKNGQQTKVVGKSEQMIKDCYKIYFDDNSTVICDSEHMWLLSDGSISSTLELKTGDKIDIAKPIDCENVELPIDPYTLGIWLGDGRNRGGEISCGDVEVFDEIKRRELKVGENTNKTRTSCEARTVFGLTKRLKKLNLIHNKHIPEIYLRSSFSQRLDLLRGLMDSDGSANETRKQCVFMNCCERLSDDVKSLLLTLGQRPLKNYTSQKYKDRIVKAYPISFRPIDINPFYLERKGKKIEGWGHGWSNRRRIEKIEKVEQTTTQCISVDSETRTYLCTKNMIPTHNTGRRYDWCKNRIKTYELLSEDKQLLLYFYALKTKYPDKKFYISIYFINDYVIDKVKVPGGVFTFAFDDQDFIKAEEMIRTQFEKIKNDNNPSQISSNCSHFKCKYMCAFSQIIPEISLTKPACMAIKEKIQQVGIKAVTEQYADFSKLTTYDGGGRLGVELKGD